MTRVVSADAVLEVASMGRLCWWRFERRARQKGWERIAGMDEAGRGLLFGPVFAAAVILNPRRRIVGLDDSKKLPAQRRQVLAQRIREHALAWCVAQVDAGRIDSWNIYQASRQAMSDAVERLSIPPDFLLIDALHLDLLVEQKPIIKGDARSVSIAAASILAKVARDEVMMEFDALYPVSGPPSTNGNGTGDHLEALRTSGPSPQHRFSFAPVRNAICWAATATQEILPLPSDGGSKPVSGLDSPPCD